MQDVHASILAFMRATIADIKQSMIATRAIIDDSYEAMADVDRQLAAGFHDTPKPETRHGSD